MTTVTADHKVTLYRNGRWAWEETHELSSRLLQFMRGISWGTNQQPPELENHSLVYSLQKTRSYLLGTMCMKTFDQFIQYCRSLIVKIFKQLWHGARFTVEHIAGLG